MFVLDTDTLSHLLRRHPRVTKRVAQANDEVVITVVSRIEILQGRFASVLKAENGDKLIQACQRLEQSDTDLYRFTILTVDTASAARFDHVRANKSLRSIGRADLLIAALTLAHNATLVTRNLKDFRKVPGLRVENWV